jgi:hypothetical protein
MLAGRDHLLNSLLLLQTNSADRQGFRFRSVERHAFGPATGYPAGELPVMEVTRRAA